jgi:hypothetical protein
MRIFWNLCKAVLLVACAPVVAFGAVMLWLCQLAMHCEEFLDQKRRGK